MGRSNPGMATIHDWSLRRQEVLAQSQAGWPEHAGNQVYMDLVSGGRTEQTMRLVFLLFDQSPLAFANFYALCTQSVDDVGESGHMLTYRRSRVHRIIKGRCLEAGDIVRGDGQGGDCLYGKSGFEDESFGLRLAHDQPGLLSMCSPPGVGKRSAFRISFGEMPDANGTDAVIGRLISGNIHLPTIEALPVDASDAPARPLTIVECGAIAGWSKLPAP